MDDPPEVLPVNVHSAASPAMRPSHWGIRPNANFHTAPGHWRAGNIRSRNESGRAVRSSDTFKACGKRPSTREDKSAWHAGLLSAVRPLGARTPAVESRGPRKPETAGLDDQFADTGVGNRLEVVAVPKLRVRQAFRRVLHHMGSLAEPPQCGHRPGCLIDWSTGPDIRTAADIDPDTIVQPGLLVGPGIGVATLIAVWCFAWYRLTRDNDTAILKQLAQRRLAVGDNT